MRSGWRLYAVMAGLAALTGTLVALALSGGPRLSVEGPRQSARPSASASATASRAAATGSPTRAPSPTPTASPTPSDPLYRVRPLVFAWRPADTTAIVERATAAGTRVIAIPLTGSAVTPLIDLPPDTQWSIRRDGSAIALTIAIGDPPGARTRIAALSFQTGAIGWVTPDESDASAVTPWWSNDGTVVYYARVARDGSDMGVYRVRADGSNLTQLRAPSSDGSIRVVGLTPDGLGLLLSRSTVSGYVDVFDLATHAIRSFQTPATLTGARPSGAVDAWRPPRPRALLSFGGPAGGPQLYLWDDLAPPASPTPLVANATVAGADWDPTATRIVAALASPGAASQLVVMDAAGREQTTLAGTEGASSPSWLRAGVVYLYADPFSRPSEVRLAAPSGSASPKTLYRDTDLIRLTYVSP